MGNGQVIARNMFGFHGRKEQGYEGNIRTRGGLMYYHEDALGNVMDVTDRVGEEVMKYRYDAFGNLFTQMAAPYNASGYTGKSYDAKASLMDYSARWYSPYYGRFTTMDTFKGWMDNPLSLNRYSYVHNNPIKYIDPTGHSAESPGSDDYWDDDGSYWNDEDDWYQSETDWWEANFPGSGDSGGGGGSGGGSGGGGYDDGGGSGGGSSGPTLGQRIGYFNSAAGIIASVVLKGTLGKTLQVASIVQGRSTQAYNFRKVYSNLRPVKPPKTLMKTASVIGMTGGIRKNLEGHGVEFPSVETTNTVILAVGGTIEGVVEGVKGNVIGTYELGESIVTDPFGTAQETVEGVQEIFFNPGDTMQGFVTSGQTFIIQLRDADGRTRGYMIGELAGGLVGGPIGKGSKIIPSGGNKGKGKSQIDKIDDKYLKSKGIDAHQLKQDVLGKKAKISQYDLYVNKNTGEIYVYKKGGKGEGIPTGEFIK